MAIYDTTNVIDNSMFLKAKLDRNMVGSNYYIENLQDKRNQDWEYRYNVVNIEEELKKQSNYTIEAPHYTPIDAVITSVKSDKGKELSSDWAHLAFKDLKHPCKIGQRYRFSLDFPDMSLMTEEEKYYDTSVWICVNQNPIKAGNSCTVRRCNTSLALVGSPTNNKEDISETHYEPCVLENEMKYMQIYYNMSIPVPQAEWYATMQLNYFTNNIKINDRFVLGAMDLDTRENNSVFKVKAIIKSTLDKTFVRNNQEEIETTPLLIIAMDKDMVAPDDDIEKRIAQDAPVYMTQEEAPAYEYFIRTEEPFCEKLMLTQEEEYKVNLCYNDKVIETDFEFDGVLNGIVQKNWDKYFTLKKTGPNTCSIRNLKSCNRGPLTINVICKNNKGADIKASFEVILGGFY